MNSTQHIITYGAVPFLEVCAGLGGSVISVRLLNRAHERSHAVGRHVLHALQHGFDMDRVERLYIEDTPMCLENLGELSPSHLKRLRVLSVDLAPNAERATARELAAVQALPLASLEHLHLYGVTTAHTQRLAALPMADLHTLSLQDLEYPDPALLDCLNLQRLRCLTVDGRYSGRHLQFLKNCKVEFALDLRAPRVEGERREGWVEEFFDSLPRLELCNELALDIHWDDITPDATLSLQDRFPYATITTVVQGRCRIQEEADKGQPRAWVG